MSIQDLSWLDPVAPAFPDPGEALDEPDGLLAAGGNLKPGTLLEAYRSGIFPWFEDDQLILWWSPSTRCVLYPAELHISRSLRRTLRKQVFSVTTDKAAERVIAACAESRRDSGTWITASMFDAYCKLAQLGHLHSVEVWRNQQVVGGLYGVQVGAVFCGESMFSLESDASKVALAYLCSEFASAGGRLIDCQLVNPHLLSMGARPIIRDSFLSELVDYRDKPVEWPEFTSVSPRV